MSKPVFEDLESFSGRRNRLSYFLFTLAVLTSNAILHAFVVGVTFVFAGDFGDGIKIVAAIILSLAFLGIFMLVYYNLIVMAQRFRDMGLSGWYVMGAVLLPILLGFISALLSVDSSIVELVVSVSILLITVIICLVPGTQGTNGYGFDPLKIS